VTSYWKTHKTIEKLAEKPDVCEGISFFNLFGCNFASVRQKKGKELLIAA
jgi:hypothetical protein